jgi:hypothetical protein
MSKWIFYETLIGGAELGARLRWYHHSWRLAVTIVVVLSSLATYSASAKSPDANEAELRERALSGAAKYLRISNLYAPQAASSERAASTVAVTGHVLLEAFLATNNQLYLDKARIAADTIVGYPDMNHNGTYGWGRYWPKIEGSQSQPGDGSNTTFAIGCLLEKNKPYDDEMYDNARIGHFLLEFYEVTKIPSYLEVVRRMIDDTWDVGERNRDGGFFYFKTIGPCDRGWHVKNVNMLMAVPIALLARITGKPKYRERLEAMIRAELDEVRRMIDGKPAPNLGYYGVQTMRDHPTQGTYVSRAQTTDLAGPISCNSKSGSGESCTAHLGLEARAMDIVLRTSDLGLLTVDDIKTIMAGHEARDDEMCAKPTTALGRTRSITYCAAYYCALRHLEPKYFELCAERTKQFGASTPDIVLGLFWGRSDRFRSPSAR